MGDENAKETKNTLFLMSSQMIRIWQEIFLLYISRRNANEYL